MCSFFCAKGYYLRSCRAESAQDMVTLDLRGWQLKVHSSFCSSGTKIVDDMLGSSSLCYSIWLTQRSSDHDNSNKKLRAYEESSRSENRLAACCSL